MSGKKKLVVLTGAGISAESGLKTFRDSDGLWENHRVEDVATPEAWSKNPEMVLRFYNERRSGVIAAQPNTAHKGLALLEDKYDVTIITQNIDDLHERGGSTNVVHLHGEILKMRSEHDNDKIYDCTGDILLGQKAPDGYQLRPHIVWFGEQVPMIETAADISALADIYVVIGTSLQVYPAAGLLHYVSPLAQKFIIDKNIPKIGGLTQVVCIEKSAVAGIEDLLKALM